MCRFTVYKGRYVRLSDILIRPTNSILAQSRDGSYHPGIRDEFHQRNNKFNEDGYGIAWYSTSSPMLHQNTNMNLLSDVQVNTICSHDIKQKLRFDSNNLPKQQFNALKRATPAWSCEYLKSIAETISAPLVVAHVRAATVGCEPNGSPYISNDNCHPFTFGKWTFVHNGCVPSFAAIQPHLLALVKPEYAKRIRGTTDSEHIFALFLSMLHDATTTDHTLEEIIEGLNSTISTLLDIACYSDITKGMSLNLCITDGNTVVASRFRNVEGELPPSLYLQFGKCNASDDTVSFVISSCPLNRDDEVITVRGKSIKSQDHEYFRINKLAPSADMEVPSEQECTAVVLENTEAHEFHCNFNWEGVNHNKLSPWILIPKNHFVASVSKSNDSSTASIVIKPIKATVGSGKFFDSDYFRELSYKKCGGLRSGAMSLDGSDSDDSSVQTSNESVFSTSERENYRDSEDSIFKYNEVY